MDKIRVLIADDHTVFCDCLKKVLEMQGDFEIVGIARSGPEAVRKAEETGPDVVLMDIQMPAMDGIRSTRLIKERLPSTSVVVLTMHHEEKYVMDSIDAGASSYLLKDLSINEVLQAIRFASTGNYMFSVPSVKSLIQHAIKSNERGSKSNCSQFQLTERDLDIISLVAAGLTNKMIAKELCLSSSTVKNYLSSIYAKLQCSNRAELVNKAIGEEIIEPVSKNGAGLSLGAK